MLLFLLSRFINSYTPSRFGYTGTDTVQAQECNSLIILHEVPKPTVRYINESGWVNPPIQLEQYGWPEHMQTASDDDLQKEVYKIFETYIDPLETFPADKLFAHPAGIKQFEGDEKMVADAPRYKFRLFMNTRYQKFHYTGVYMPPGEAITIEIPEKAVRKVKAHLNRHCKDKPDWNFRTKRLSFYMTLDKRVSQIAWPFGANLVLEIQPDAFNYGFDVNITGGIRMPTFKYGVNTDKEWEEELSKLPAPLMILDTGATVITGPSVYARNAIKLNDAMAVWRGVSRVLYSINEVEKIPRRADGRVIRPMQFHLDSFVPNNAGALAYVWYNYVQAPSNWYQGFANYDYIRYGAWGQFHEYGHHFQENWGIGNYIEVTNNALNLISMSKMCEMTETRQVNFKDEYQIVRGSWNNRAHPYKSLTYKDMLAFYSNYLYFFGHDLWRKILKAHTSQQTYKRSQYKYHGEFLLHLCTMSKRDVRPFYKTFNGLTEGKDTTPYLNYENDIPQEVHTIIDNMHLKELHPVACLYQTGYLLDDNTEIETARPFIIPCRQPYTFDFAKYKTTVRGCHDFAFESISGGQGRFAPTQTKGEYIYTPPDDIHVIDKFYVKYKDTTNQQITTVVVKVRQITKGISVYYYQTNRPRITTAYSVILRAKNYAFSLITSGMNIPDQRLSSNARWIAMAEGVFIPEKTSPHKFLFKHIHECEFYISENPLPNDQAAAAQYRIAYLQGRQRIAVDWNRQHSSDFINLDQNKRYYFRFIMVNGGGYGRGEVGFIYSDDDTEIKPVTDKMTQFTNAKADDVDTYEFIPQCENDPTLGHFADSRDLKYDNRKFKYAKQDNGQYTVDFKHQIKFDRLRIERQDITNFQISCDGNPMQNLHISNNVIDFDTPQTCKVLIIPTTSGNKMSRVYPILRNVGTTDNIIPATHTKIKLTGPGELSREGIYYNGKGWHLNETAKLTCNVHLNSSGNSIVVIGDRHLNYGGGILDVYDGTKHLGSVDTAYIDKEDAKNMATNEFYQSILFSIDGLEANSQHTISLVARKGKVEIAGLLANANLEEVTEPLQELQPPQEESEEENNIDETEFEDETNNESGNDDNEHQNDEGGNQNEEEHEKTRINEGEQFSDNENEKDKGNNDDHNKKGDEGNNNDDQNNNGDENEEDNNDDDNDDGDEDDNKDEDDDGKKGDENTKAADHTSTPQVSPNGDDANKGNPTKDSDKDKNKVSIIIGAVVGTVVVVAGVIGAVLVVKIFFKKPAVHSEDVHQAGYAV